MGHSLSLKSKDALWARFTMRAPQGSSSSGSVTQQPLGGAQLGAKPIVMLGMLVLGSGDGLLNGET